MHKKGRMKMIPLILPSKYGQSFLLHHHFDVTKSSRAHSEKLSINFCKTAWNGKCVQH